ncbi:MAG: hypothetical protein M3126_09075 [Candidatus Eremiobacteraeota bacterium]|nr:hypothetical protein [Candidatus Eremiobacteraeota bacterium]
MKFRFLARLAPELMPRCEGIFGGATRCRRIAVLECDQGHKFCKEHAIEDTGEPEIACSICTAAEMLNGTHDTLVHDTD